MAQDITEQASQEELADALVSDSEASPQEETVTEEAQPEQTEQAESEEQTEEAADDWLPTEQEKVFPDEVLAKYASRYQKDEKWLSDPLNRQLLIEKINSDIFLRTLQQQQQEEPEEEYEEPEPQQEPTQPQSQLTFDQHVQNIQAFVKQNTSPDMAQWMFKGFMTAFGVPDSEIAALAPKQAQAFTEVLSVGALNLIQSIAPQLFGTYMPQMLEQQFPEFSGMYNSSATARNWDSVRNEFQDANLPQYGTREYSSAARAIGASIAGSAERFESMVFTGRNGQPLSAAENRGEKLRMIAERMIEGSQDPQIPPAVMAQAVQTGQKIAQRKAAQQSAGNLGAGKSKAQIARTGDDDFWADGIAEYQKQHGSL
jgi:hypothetical protein